MSEEVKRETLSSRLGFIFLAAGCAIGLGNIWRFPAMVGMYGGGYFVLLYVIFLIIFGLPALLMELAMGRASRRNLVGAYDCLAHSNKKVWRNFGKLFFSGNWILLMFYTTVSGWMIAYTFFAFRGDFANLSSETISQKFGNFLADPYAVIFYMLLTVVIGAIICSFGLKNGVERIVKYMMSLLLLLISILAIYAITLPNAIEGVKFYLCPSWENLRNAGILRVVAEAMGQAFFTLSIGIGSMEIYGSYVNKKHTLLQESTFIIALDTFVAFVAGLIIFPACFAYNVNTAAGPTLIFEVLPNVFSKMTSGRLVGTAFFGLMSLAALTTVIAVMENLIAYYIDEKRYSRIKASIFVGSLLAVLSLPCALGFNLWKNFQPFGKGSTILDLEDFILSNNLLPLGGVVIIIFCIIKKGWGYSEFMKEVNEGAGMRFPSCFKYYMLIVIPALIIFLAISNILSRLGVNIW
ncbi:MAG: sodium-dependent transporter [Lentisphaeria bacterium]|nr:sodium-dependent transporter [Lentisphaeria bacterium]